ncbi:MAG: hypothetical protein ACYTGL_07210 [Planctomycetota bacterium]|jgi:hypothetical protein
MSAQSSTPALNDLLNRLSRSWLQYIGEAWPWAPSENSDRLDALQALVRRQHFAAERLASLLTARRAHITLRNYPFDGSNLNYVTLDFVKPRLEADEQAIIAELKAAVHGVEHDPEALRLIEQLTADEEQTLSELSAL